ncbi:hypothetical protein VHUM_03593 [Vanrija humicola]|uniref:NmrA-like domain-containing protein n=1 Tax=Vanrija humicola TaxID=5417 RepID=A0A7D8UZ63_VANHU|nr:hypothetical protein VHUM_03593 [Vanrija humicola]
MAPTIAVIAPTGLLGHAIVKALADGGKATVVALHRASSDLSKLPKGVQTRVLDYESASAADVHKALEGVDILVAVSKASSDADIRFLEALASLPHKLKAYVPSDYSVAWTAGEDDDPANAIVYNKVVAANKAKELGVQLTPVLNGSFEPFTFFPGFVGVWIADNKAKFYGDALNRELPVTSPGYLGAGVAQLVTSPELVPGNTYTIVEQKWTGQQVVDAIAKAKGADVKVETFTDADLEALRANGPLGVLSGALIKKWGAGEFPEVNPFKPEGVTPRTVDQAVESALGK